MIVFKPRVLKNLIHTYIPAFIVEDRVVIDTWVSFTGVHPAPGVIELDDKPSVTMRLGDRWRVGYDDTRFFETELTVPESFAAALSAASGSLSATSFGLNSKACAHIRSTFELAVSALTQSSSLWPRIISSVCVPIEPVEPITTTFFMS